MNEVIDKLIAQLPQEARERFEAQKEHVRKAKQRKFEVDREQASKPRVPIDYSCQSTEEEQLSDYEVSDGEIFPSRRKM